MSSRIWCWLAIILSIFITACIPQAHPRNQAPVQTAVRTETEVITPVVTGKSTLLLNVREKASSKTAVIDKLPKNTQVELLDKSGSWYKVKRTDGSGKTGFVFYKYITLDFGNYLGTRGRNKKLAVIHDTPSSKSKTALKISPQTTFDIIGYENGFYKVHGDSFEGYVLSELCVADPSSPIAKTNTVTIKSTISDDKVKITKKTGKKSVHGGKKSAGNDAVAAIFGSFFGVKQATPEQKKQAEKLTAEHQKKAEASNGNFFDNLVKGLDNASKAQGNNPNSLDSILKKLDQSKELAAQTIEIREKMLKALNETKALQGLVGATIAAMNNDYKTATDTAQGVCSTGMKKISIKAFIKDLSYEPTTSIEQASVKIAENGKRLKALESKIKSEANTFSKLKEKQLTNIDAVISTFSNNIHASNALYDMSMDKSSNVIGNIDSAMAAYDEKADKVAAEAVRQAAIMTESGLIIAQLIANAASNPIYGVVALPQIYRAEEQIRKFVTLFNDFNNDYNYIEENSALISKQGKDISKIIMTARRKNTQITTILERYFQKKMELSSRLKKRLASQAEEGYKEVEKKAESVAIEEAELD